MVLSLALRWRVEGWQRTLSSLTNCVLHQFKFPPSMIQGGQTTTATIATTATNITTTTTIIATTTTAAAAADADRNIRTQSGLIAAGEPGWLFSSG